MLRDNIATIENLSNFNEYASITATEIYTFDGWFPGVKIVLNVVSVGGNKATANSHIVFGKSCIMVRNADMNTFFEYEDPTSIPIIIELILKWINKHVHQHWDKKHAH